MKRNYILLVFAVLISMISCSGETYEAEEPRESESPRTVLMYLVANNSIGTDVVANISDVEKGLQASNLPEGTFVIYVDGGQYLSSYSTPTLFKYVVDAEGKVGQRQVIKSYPEQNSCSASVITTVLKDVKRLCPAASYALTFGSHATGWLPTDMTTRSMGDDEGEKIEVPEFAKAVANANIHFDYILMDACLMSQVEVAYELRNVADYLIMSPAEVMAYGFPYNKMVADMLATGNKEDNAIALAEEYINFYKSYTLPWATISVIKTNEMDNLAEATRNMLAEYSDRLAQIDESVLNGMQVKCNYARGSMAYSSYDIRSFANILTDYNVPTSFLDALDNAVVYKSYVNAYKLSSINIDKAYFSGLGCYVPNPQYTKWNEYYETLSWNKAVHML
jgi:hypothetical protein